MTQWSGLERHLRQQERVRPDPHPTLLRLVCVEAVGKQKTHLEILGEAAGHAAQGEALAVGVAVGVGVAAGKHCRGFGERGAPSGAKQGGDDALRERLVLARNAGQGENLLDHVAAELGVGQLLKVCGFEKRM